MRTRDPRRGLAVAQGTYWLTAGLWPILHIRSFEAITGPKQARWLVRTMGALISAVGGTLLYAAARRRVGAEIAFLGGTSAIALGGAGAWYAGRGRIRSVYLVDAAAEGALAAAWLWTSRRGGRHGAAARGALASALADAYATRLPIERGEAVPEI
jgi:hypothetical protein